MTSQADQTTGTTGVGTTNVGTTDADPDETAEWLESFDAAVAAGGPERGRWLLDRMAERADGSGQASTAARFNGVAHRASGDIDHRGDSAHPAFTTDFVNTIPADADVDYPGDEKLEAQLEDAIRWNAAVMVTRANRPGLEVGGHISTYQSVATLYEVGLNHFFRGKDHPGGGDQVYFQGHASPGVYARCLLEGRLSTERLDAFRQESSKGRGNGLSSYPHPRLMPWLWEFPTVAMGIGPLNSMYQARFNRYLHNRGIKDTSEQRVWAFLGDGEMGEPESLGGLTMASREGLDNLIFVINCNLQQLDGPVRGNGKIVQELESLFRGANWRVIKLIWGSDWDALFAKDTEGELARRLTEVPDGQFQTFSTEKGDYIRKKLFNTPTLEKLVEDLSDEQLVDLSRGGHDRRKVFAAYSEAVRPSGKPTVILAHTVKGHGIGALQGRNATHQMKKLTKDDLKKLRDRMQLPISDEQIDDDYPYYLPGEDSPVQQLAVSSRKELGGFLPERRTDAAKVDLPGDKPFTALSRGSGKQKVATTMALVRLLRDLMKEPGIGKRFVPIAPDEYRTFGMDSMFASAKIYDPNGQIYDSVDRDLLLKYKTAVDGQMLHEGINELGCVASVTAAGTSYATHSEPMIPFYIFYSQFGFQRTGDWFWALSDQLGRGFVIGATAGRTTLTGEGLQHADGHSLLLASSNPAVVAYDPAFAYEIAHIFRSGLERMYGSTESHPHGEDVWFYLTVYNEPMEQPAEPEGVDVDGMLRGIYRYLDSPEVDGPKVTLLASGVGVPWAIKARDLLAQEWGIGAAIYSVTSWNELRRDAVEAEKHNLLHPEAQREPFVTTALRNAPGPFIASSDWMRAVPDQISRFVPGDYTSLGCDGFGLADTRAAARRYFQVDAESITVAAIASLARRGEYDAAKVREALDRYQIDDPTAVAHVQQEGAGA